ncbi:MAG: acyltransferase [Ruminococcaceae bacterium]|nr:acyltransferase [Oscillospiraceae bacterium]
MRRVLGNIISILFSFFKFFFIKLFHFNKFSYYWIERFSPNVIVRIGRKSKLKLGKKVRMHSGSKLLLSADGELDIGDNCRFNYNCMIVCHHSITIGSGVEFGPGVYVYDHDHDFRAEGGMADRKYKSSPVTIGENSWIGANTIILRGTSIGKNCVIGAGCVVKGDVPDNTILVQKRENEFISL